MHPEPVGVDFGKTETNAWAIVYEKGRPSRQETFESLSSAWTWTTGNYGAYGRDWGFESTDQPWELTRNLGEIVGVRVTTGRVLEVRIA